MDVHPSKNVSIGIDPYPYDFPNYKPPFLKGISQPTMFDDTGG
jgi:hypothetical protein